MYEIKHEKQTELVKSKIGVKLADKLAEEKGIGPYGHTETPGPFKGGRRVDREKE